jgi:hypothetical protein
LLSINFVKERCLHERGSKRKMFLNIYSAFILGDGKSCLKIDDESDESLFEVLHTPTHWLYERLATLH